MVSGRSRSSRSASGPDAFRLQLWTAQGVRPLCQPRGDHYRMLAGHRWQPPLSVLSLVRQYSSTSSSSSSARSVGYASDHRRRRYPPTVRRPHRLPAADQRGSVLPAPVGVATELGLVSECVYQQVSLRESAARRLVAQSVSSVDRLQHPPSVSVRVTDSATCYACTQSLSLL